MSQRLVAIIQARMGSSRLPGKVLEDIAGKPMLGWVLDRVSAAHEMDEVVVATSINPSDDLICEYVRAAGKRCFRGSEHDVLDRFHDAAHETGADVVVRITSDCPLIDPELISATVAALRETSSRMAYSSNTLPPRTYPRGLDVEAFTGDALEAAWRDDRDPASREHVTPYIYRHPEAFALRRVAAESDYSRHRWTVDTADDLALVRAAVADLGRVDFGWRDVLRLFAARPELERLNAHVEQKVPGFIRE